MSRSRSQQTTASSAAGHFVDHALVLGPGDRGVSGRDVVVDELDGVPATLGADPPSVLQLAANAEPFVGSIAGDPCVHAGPRHKGAYYYSIRRATA